MEYEEYLKEQLRHFGFSNTYMRFYKRQEKVGYIYSFEDSFYGPLTRLYCPKSKEDAYQFVFAFWWYLKYRTVYFLEIGLKDYTVLETSFILSFEGKPLDLFHLNDFCGKKPEKKSNETVYLNYQRTFLLLKEILENLLKAQYERYQSLLPLQQEVAIKENEYKKKHALYFKTGEEISSSVEVLEDLENDTSLEILNYFQESWNFVNKENEEEMHQFIETMFAYLKQTEENEMDLLNQYYLLRLPKEISFWKEKIKILEQAISKTSRLFRKKNDVSKMLETCDDISELKQLESSTIYIAHKRKEIDALYDSVALEDLFSWGDALIHKHILDIEIPPKVVSQKKEKLLKSVSESLNYLHQSYEALDEKKKEALLAYHSFLRKYFDKTEFDYGEKEGILGVLHSFGTYEGMKIQKKYFPHLNAQSITSFLASIKAYKEILENSVIKVPGPIFAYTHQSISSSSLSISFSLQKAFMGQENELPIFLKIDVNSFFYFSPMQILYEEFAGKFYVVENSSVGTLLLPFEVLSKRDILVLDVDVWQNDVIVKDCKKYVEMVIGGQNEEI